MDIKRGVNTSEFWLVISTIIFANLNTYLGWHLPVESIGLIAAGTVSYIVSRTIVKVKTNGTNLPSLT